MEKKNIEKSFFEDCKKLKYYIYHTYFYNKEHVNISSSRLMDSRWSCLFDLVDMTLHFQTTSAEAPGPIVIIFHIKPSGVWGTKVYSNGSNLLTKEAAMPIYGKST